MSSKLLERMTKSFSLESREAKRRNPKESSKISCTLNVVAREARANFPFYPRGGCNRTASDSEGENLKPGGIPGGSSNVREPHFMESESMARDLEIVCRQRTERKEIAADRGERTLENCTRNLRGVRQNRSPGFPVKASVTFSLNRKLSRRKSLERKESLPKYLWYPNI